MQVQEQQLTELVLSTLQFNTLLVTLLLGAQGFVFGRLWPEKAALPPRKVGWLLPGFLVALGGVYLTVAAYRKLGAAVSSNEILSFYKGWLNSYWQVHVSLFMSVVLTIFGAVVAGRR